MKALTIRQPWAHAIVWGPKRVENRRWWTTHRGPLAIHAAQSTCGLLPRMALEMIGVRGEAAQRPMEFGKVIGVAELVDCVIMPRELETVRPGLNEWFGGDILSWAIGPWCWLLRDVRPINPVACAGRQGLWNFDGRVAPLEMGVQPCRQSNPPGS